LEKITLKTTLKDLIEIGLIEKSMIDVWNSRIERKSRSDRRQQHFTEVNDFIKENLQEGVAYKTGNFLEDVLKEKSHIGSHMGEGQRKYIHTLITLSLKSLVDDGTLIVFNNTNNHAHNRYGLKPDLDKVPTFETNK